METLKTSADRAAPAGGSGRYKRVDQPVSVISVDGALLKLSTLAAISGQSLSTLHRAAKSGVLVLTKRGTRCTRVRAEDARKYLQHLAGGEA